MAKKQAPATAVDYGEAVTVRLDRETIDALEVYAEQMQRRIPVGVRITRIDVIRHMIAMELERK